MNTQEQAPKQAPSKLPKFEPQFYPYAPRKAIRPGTINDYIVFTSYDQHGNPIAIELLPRQSIINISYAINAYTLFLVTSILEGGVGPEEATIKRDETDLLGTKTLVTAGGLNQKVYAVKGLQEINNVMRQLIGEEMTHLVKEPNDKSSRIFTGILFSNEVRSYFEQAAKIKKEEEEKKKTGDPLSHGNATPPPPDVPTMQVVRENETEIPHSPGPDVFRETSSPSLESDNNIETPLV